MKKTIEITIFSVSILMFLVSIFTLIAMPEYLYVSLISLIIAFIGIIILCVKNKKKVIKIATSKYGKNIIDNTIGFFLVFCILGLVNYIAFKRPIIWDLGDRKLNSLTAQSIKVLNNFEDEVTITIFSSPEQRQAISNFLQLYTSNNSGVTVKYIDPEIRADLVSHYGVTISPSLVLEKKDQSKKQIITQIKELTLTNAFITLRRETNPLLCFNYSNIFEDGSENGYTGIIHVLKQSAFDLKIVNLLQAKEIPKSCQVYSVLSPSSDFSDEELAKMESYYKAGGVFLFALSPMLNGDKLFNLRNFILKNGIDIQNNVVIDNKNHVNGSRGSAPIIKEFDSKGINSQMEGQVFFPISSSVVGVNSSEDKTSEIDYVPLARSSNDSWAENSILELMSENLKFDDKDVMGPINMAIGKVIKDRVRMIVLGNGSLVSNKFYKYQSNFQFLLNIFFWASGEDQLTSVQANIISDKPVFISDLQKKVIFYFTIIILPLLFIFIGIFQYRRRK